MKIFRKLVLIAIIIGVVYFLKGNMGITGMTIMDVQDIVKDKIEDKVVVQEDIPLPVVFFCPKYNCEAVMVDLIKNAKKSAHCALFDLDLYELISMFDERSEEIDVKIVVDNDNYEEIEESYGKELEFVKIDNGNQLSHNKFCIIDGKVVSTGSFNPTFNGNEKNNNNLVVIESDYLSENYEDEFEELWKGYFGRSNKDKQKKVKYPKIEGDEIIIENYFCPEDDCEGHVLDVLKNAEESVKFMVFSFTSDPIGEKLVEMHENGIIVEGVLEKKQNTNKYSEYHRLIEAGVDVIYDNNKYNMHHKNGLQTHYPKSGLLHHKVFIIDDHIVITGSYNPTASGTEKNDENIL
ncbi:hypothetical protein HN695_08125, partial [Candidatus Woesearchaeota archaeon]|nr:hypothetical protein [Candidatus Woesearchaeota archaeon]